MVKKINLIAATLYSIILAIVEAILNWGDWQYAPLWIVDYLIVIILLLAVFVFKEIWQTLSGTNPIGILQAPNYGQLYLRNYTPVFDVQRLIEKRSIPFYELFCGC